MKVKKVAVGIRTTEEALTEAAETMKAVAAGRSSEAEAATALFHQP